MARTVYRETRRRYHWPEIQLNIWIVIVLAGSATCLGIFAWFMTVQTQMELGIPWYVYSPENNSNATWYGSVLIMVSRR